MGEAKRKGHFKSQQPSQKLGDAPVEQEYYDLMVKTMRAIDQLFNGDAKGQDRKTGIVMLVFPFGEDAKGRCNFMSNGANRKDVVVLMKEMIARFEGQPEMEGHA